MATEVIAAGLAIDSGDFIINNEAVTFSINGTLVGAEKVAFSVSPDGGTTFFPISTTPATELTLTNNPVRIEGPCLVRLTKTVTTNAVGVGASRYGNL